MTWRTHVEELLERAEQAYAADDLAGARSVYREVLRGTPGHPLAKRAVSDIEKELGERFAPNATIALALSIDALLEIDTSSREAFVISRLAAGDMSVRRLSEVSRLEGADLHEILYRCVQSGLVVVR